MADEEVDWGMEEDVWRQGGNVSMGENEDEISLDGMEGESDVIKPSSQKPSNSPRTSMSRPPPTGPRKPVGRGDGPISSPSNGPIRGPKRGRSGRNRQASRAGNANDIPIVPRKSAAPVAEVAEAKPAPVEVPVVEEVASAAPSQTQSVVSDQPPAEAAPVLEPLPEGWTEVFSRTQKAIFYHNKTTGETCWSRPRNPPVEEDRPITPPPAAVPTPPTANGSTTTSAIIDTTPVSASSVVAPASTDATLTRQERAPPTGPGADKATAPAVDAIDPVQSAYASRRTNRASRESRPASASILPAVPAGAGVPARPDDRGTKRSLSPRREETKRSRLDEPSRNYDNDRAVSNNPPAGPRSFGGEGRAPRSPQRQSLDRRESYRPDDRSQRAGLSLPPPIARGSNSAPLIVSKWGARPEPAPTTSPAVADREPIHLPPLERETSSPAPTRAPSVSDDPAAIRRQRLREEARRAEETLKQIKEEEARLEREEEEERRRKLEDVERKRRGEDRMREEEERRRREDPWRRSEEQRRAHEDRVPRGSSPQRSAFDDDRSYRPAASPPPPHAPPPSNRLDGPGQPVGIRDARRARPDSPSRVARRTSPAAYPAAQDRSRSRELPSSRYPNRPASPLGRNGDSYHPDGDRGGERDRGGDRERGGRRDRRGPAVPLADRIGRSAGRQAAARQPEISADFMRGRPRSPPPAGRGNDTLRRGEPQPAAGGYRPLAERMSRGAGGSRDGGNGRFDTSARRM